MTTLTSRKAPQELFNAFDGATEAEKVDLREKVMAWLLQQPKDAKTVYIVPDPDTGAETFLAHPGLH